MFEFLDWLAKVGGVIAILVTSLGFIFREKWKQILQRSLSEDLERLKSELAKSQAEHAASLTPQLESVKHDFQQKIEAYKVSLIAQAESIKAKEELRKTIALRYSEVEFERLVSLERAAGPIASYVLSMATIDIAFKSVENITSVMDRLRAFGVAADEAEMFLSLEDHSRLITLRQKLLTIIQGYVGYQRSSLSATDGLITEVVALSAQVHSALKQRIHEIGKL